VISLDEKGKLGIRSRRFAPLAIWGRRHSESIRAEAGDEDRAH
jgi:hypothetical protein